MFDTLEETKRFVEDPEWHWDFHEIPLNEKGDRPVEASFGGFMFRFLKASPKFKQKLEESCEKSLSSHPDEEARRRADIEFDLGLRIIRKAYIYSVMGAIFDEEGHAMYDI